MDRLERYLFVYEAVGVAQVQAAMRAMGVSKAQLLGTEKEYTAAIRAQSRAVEQSTSRWMKHLHWIAQGILIWEGIRIIKTVIGDWITVQRELDTELTRFRIAMGDSDEAAQAYLETVMAISREMRMPPGEIAGAVGIAYRVGEVEIAEYAAGIARLTGGDTTTILRELIALHRQFPERQMIDIMDEWISAWQKSTLTAGEFFNLLESSGGLVKFFNTDLNTLLNLFTHITTVAGEAGGSVERFVRMFTKFYEEGHKLREITEQFIGPTVMFDPTTGAEVRRPIEDIIQAIGELNEAQQQTISNNFPSMLGQQYGPWFLQVVKGFEVTAAEAGAFDRAMSIMSDSFQDKARGMESAWQRFLSALGDTETIKQAMGDITQLLEATERLFTYEELRQAWPETSPFPLGQRDPMAEAWGRILGIEPAPGAYPAFPMTGQQFQQWGAYGEAARGFDWGARHRPPAYTGEYDVPLPPGLEGLPKERFKLPEGMSVEQFMAGEKALFAEQQEAVAGLERFEEAISRDITLTDEHGIALAVTTVNVTDLGDAAKYAEEMIAETSLQFSRLSPAEWALATQAYPGYRDLYKQWGQDPGELISLIGPGGELFRDVFEEPMKDAIKRSRTELDALADSTREVIRWHDKSVAAYQKGVSAWEGAILKVPGVTTPTDVTAFDLYALTPTGLYKDKWDEPMRRLKQDVNDILAGNKPEYGVIDQPWAAEIFGPVRGLMGTGTPEGRAAAGGAYEQAAGRFYGLTLPWEVYEPQADTFISALKTWVEDRATKEANIENLKQLAIGAGLGAEAMGFIEYVEMSPLVKQALGGKTYEEWKEEWQTVGSKAGAGISEGMLAEFKDKPWIEQVVSEWDDQIAEEKNLSLLASLGRSMGSATQTGFIEAMGDNIFPAVVAYIIALINEEEF